MTSLRPRALIVDDDDTVRFGITDFLGQYDFVTAEASTCETAVDTFRSLKRRNGTSGEETRDAMTTNATISTAARASRPSVRAVVQPTPFPLTTA